MFSKIDKKEFFCLILILILTSFFRLYKLDSIPPGLYPDEAINGNEAIFTPGRVFYKENNGREGLFINLIFLSFKIFDASIWSFRITSAIIGILTVLGLYLLVKELFTIYNLQFAKKLTLLSSFFLATSFWHTNFSRIGFRAVLLPFLSVFGLYFLFRGLRQRKVLDFIISGIFFGLGFYTYASYRFIVLLLPLILACWWFIYREKKLEKQFLLVIGYWLLAIIIIALPIGLYFLQNPHDFIGRAGQVSIFESDYPIKEFGKSLILHLGMFNFYGDHNWRHNISGFPILFWPIGILFLIGLFYSFKEYCFAFKNKNYSLATTHCSLLGWWFIMLLPGILTKEGIPHALRCIGAIPPTFIFAGLGGLFIFEFIKKRIPFKVSRFNCYLIIFSSILLVLSFILAQYNRYFELWAKNPEVEGAFSKDFVEIGNYLNSLPDEVQKYVIVNQPGVPVPYPEGIPMPAQTPMFIEATRFGKPRASYLLPEDLDKIKVPTVNTQKKEVEIVLMRYNEEIFSKLMTTFPGGRIQKQNVIWAYKIK